jgi:hypothetical protein
MLGAAKAVCIVATENRHNKSVALPRMTIEMGNACAA